MVVYFVPENTALQRQIRNFQARKERIALVVDEYGDVQGIVTLEDILEEIVGEFTTDLASASSDIHPQEDGSFVVLRLLVQWIDDSVSRRGRHLSPALTWDLPADGPKTLNGLMTDRLETFPEAPVSIEIDEYRLEVVRLKDNMIATAKLTRRAATE